MMQKKAVFYVYGGACINNDTSANCRGAVSAPVLMLDHYGLY